MNNLTSQLNPVDAWKPFRPSSQTPWTTPMAAHLLRRAGFGGSREQIDAAVNAGLTATLDQLFDLNPAKKYDREMQISARMVTTGPDAKGLAAWWLLRMAKSPCPVQEKMTLFWHGHFATSAEKVGDARAMLRQNYLLRRYCLDKFQPLVAGLSRDVAMLIYLDSTENRKTRPNENYARELMELFCLGPGNYTETDIKEIARCFTGWEVRNNRFKFNPYQHDEGEKEFLGVRGQFDGDAAIAAILQQPAAARFLAKKLIRFFVFDDSPISNQLAEPIAVELRAADFDIQSVLRKVLTSQIFYSEQSIAKKIKSPVELAIGTLRFFDASVNLQQLTGRLERLGQLPLYPPNVKGWDGGRSWINAATILARANLVENIFSNRKTQFAAGGLKQWLQAEQKPESAAALDWVNEKLLATPLSHEATAGLQQLLDEDPLTGLTCLAALPEYQLN